MKIKILILFGIIFILNSCFTAHLDVLNIDNPAPYTSLKGILADKRNARFLIVHGMTTHHEGYQYETINGILEQLDWKEPEVEKKEI